MMGWRNRRRWFGAMAGAAGVAAVLWALAVTLAGPGGIARSQERPARLLYFTHAAGYRHEVIPASRAVMRRLGEASPRFEVTATEDVAEFTPDNLARYGAVMFFTTGELPMNEAQKAALIGFVRGGGGFIGVHSATDTFYEWPEYGRLIGGYFDQHPWHQKVRIEVADRDSPLVAAFGAAVELNDEIYQIRDFDPATSHVLLRLDPASVDLTRPDVHRHPYGWPLAWTRRYGEGRVFYTALGHEEGVWRDPGFGAMLRGAVLWATNRDAASRLPPGSPR
jgi:type 1 glutamine amidotransferase